MNLRNTAVEGRVFVSLAMGQSASYDAFAATPVFAAKKPNIVVIMGDDVGWFNIGA